MDLSGIISVSGMGGLYKVVSQTRNGLMIESLSDGKRLPVFSTNKISALEDISIYGVNEDIPLKEVFASIKASGKTEFPGAKDSTKVISAAFAEVLPSYDADRVYVSDMKKVFGWFQVLEAKGLLEASEADSELAVNEDVKPIEKVAKKEAVKAKPKATSAPKATSKGMAKTSTVRKTGA